MLGPKPKGTMGIVEHVKKVYGVSSFWEAFKRGGLRCGTGLQAMLRLSKACIDAYYSSTCPL